MENMSYLKNIQISELEKILKGIKEHKSIKDRLALKIMKKQKKNTQYFFKNEASFYRKDINLSNNDIEDLTDKKLLKFISLKEERLTLTLKSIFMLEYGILNPTPNMDKMLTDVNDIFFEKILGISDQLLESREIAIILALLGTCAISKDYGFTINENNQKHFKAIVDIAANFIHKLGDEYDDGTIGKLWSRDVVGEGPILGEIRRANNISTRTEKIYDTKKVNGISIHYLDILSNNQVNENKLTYLLKRLFSKRPLSFTENKDLIFTLNNIHQYSYKLFRNPPLFDEFKIRKQIRRQIERNI